VRYSIENYSEEEVKCKMDIVRTFLTSLVEPFSFERPTTIDLPLRGFIAGIQANVKHTRMGHGKKNATFEDEEESDPWPPSKRPAHVLVSHSKQKKPIFLKVPKAHCEKCKVNTIVEAGDDFVLCRNCDSPLILN
jgi:hypothetical protein